MRFSHLGLSSFLLFFFISSCGSPINQIILMSTPTPNYIPLASTPSYIEAYSIHPEPTIETISKQPIIPIQLAWFHNAPLEESSYPILAKYFDIIEFTESEENQRDTIKAMGYKGTFLQYILFNGVRDEDPRTCFEVPYPARADSQVGDYCMLKEQHPDWFIKTSDGQQVLSDYNGSIMDPGNDGWRNFWLERVRPRQEQLGWDGVLLDNVEASSTYLERFSQGQLPATFSETEYLTAIEGFLKFLYTSYFQPHGQLLYGNIIGLKDPAVWFRYLQYLDGVMMEDFAVDWENGYLEPAQWEEKLSIAQQTQALGKSVILVSQGKEDDLKRQEFALASYLLINEGKAYFRYAYAGKSLHHPGISAYADVWMYKNYLLELGQPLGSAYKQGNIWKREFEYGYVAVDPVYHTAEFNGR